MKNSSGLGTESRGGLSTRVARNSNGNCPAATRYTKRALFVENLQCISVPIVMLLLLLNVKFAALEVLYTLCW